MERILIYTDNQAFNRQKIVFLNNLSILNEIADQYNKLGIGKITPERIQEIISGNFDDIEATIIDAATKQVKTNVLKDFVSKGIFERLETFQRDVSVLASKFERNQYRATFGIISTPVEYFTIKNGKFEITDETWQLIKNERCSNFISTEKELKLFEALQRLAAATNDFMNCVGENAKLKYFPPNDPSEFLIQTDNGFEPDPETDYKFLTQ